jgi:hypothetical protein
LLAVAPAAVALLLLAEGPRDMDHKSSKLLLGFGFAPADGAVAGAMAGVEPVRIGGEVGAMVVGRMGGDVTPPNVAV